MAGIPWQRTSKIGIPYLNRVQPSFPQQISVTGPGRWLAWLRGSPGRSQRALQSSEPPSWQQTGPTLRPHSSKLLCCWISSFTRLARIVPEPGWCLSRLLPGIVSTCLYRLLSLAKTTLQRQSGSDDEGSIPAGFCLGRFLPPRDGNRSLLIFCPSLTERESQPSSAAEEPNPWHEPTPPLPPAISPPTDVLAANSPEKQHGFSFHNVA